MSGFQKNFISKFRQIIMHNKVKKLLLSIGLLLSSIVVVAHPGHGTFTGNEIAHYFTSPLHLGFAMAAVVLALVLIRKRLSKRA